MQVLIAKIVESYNPAHRQPDKQTRSHDSGPSRKFEWFFTPLLGPLLSSRLLTGILLAFGFIQLLLVITGFEGWQWPINRALGVTCPGCGLTTAMTLMASGQWNAAMRMHAYAPLLLVILTGMTAAVAQPADYLAKLSAVTTKVKRKTAISAIIIFSMLLFWLLRVFTI